MNHFGLYRIGFISFLKYIIRSLVILGFGYYFGFETLHKCRSYVGLTDIKTINARILLYTKEK